MAEITTIKISKKNKERLEKLRIYKRESYDEMVQRILDILNICRIDPERAQRRLLIFEKQSRRGKREEPFLEEHQGNIQTKNKLGDSSKILLRKQGQSSQSKTNR